MGYKITNIIISLILVSLIVTILTQGITNIASRNDIPFDNASIEKYNRLQETQILADNLRNNESESAQGGSLFDIVGELFNKGLTTLRVTRDSYSTIEELTNDAAKDLSLGNIGTVIGIAISVILIIIVVVGIFLSTLTKRDQ